MDCNTAELDSNRLQHHETKRVRLCKPCPRGVVVAEALRAVVDLRETRDVLRGEILEQENDDI